MGQGDCGVLVFSSVPTVLCIATLLHFRYLEPHTIQLWRADIDCLVSSQVPRLFRCGRSNRPRHLRMQKRCYAVDTYVCMHARTAYGWLVGSISQYNMEWRSLVVKSCRSFPWAKSTFACALGGWMRSGLVAPSVCLVSLTRKINNKRQAWLFSALDHEVSRGPIDFRRDWTDEDDVQPR